MCTVLWHLLQHPDTVTVGAVGGRRGANSKLLVDRKAVIQQNENFVASREDINHKKGFIWLAIRWVT